MHALEEVSPGVRRLTAPNQSAFTHTGTNTYILGGRRLTVIDPGPDESGHLEDIVSSGEVERILVTHAHLDHSALVPRLKARTGAEVLAFGDARAGRNPKYAELRGLVGGEGVDSNFVPDRLLADGDTLDTGAGILTALHTPGHMGNHLCFALGDVVFSGDLVMGWATSLVSPPDGDLTAYMSSLRRLMRRGDRLFLPGHGPAVRNPAARLRELHEHRLKREGQILSALKSGPSTAGGLAGRIYSDVDPSLLPAAARNVLAHLLDLEERGRVSAPAPLAADTRFSLMEKN